MIPAPAAGAGSRWLPILIIATATLTVANVGGALTDLGPWYQALRQPAWKPADILFPVIWTTIFVLAGIAAHRAWQAANGGRAAVIAAFSLTGILNMLWSLLFFTAQRPDWALIETGFLWLSILVLILVCRRHSLLAAWLLVPYLVWVSAAALLNWQVIELNGPFG